MVRILFFAKNISGVNHIVISDPGSLFPSFYGPNSRVLWIAGTLCLVLVIAGIVIFVKKNRGDQVRGRKLSFRERFQFRKASIVLSGDKNYKPKFITIRVQNPGKRPVDLQAPVLIFKRWNSSRKFRINSFGGIDDFPIWLEPGYEAKWNVELGQFYNKVPELRRACRLSAEMKEVSVKKFISRTIRLKWL